ncbi:hypothetical protein PF005_g4919 [Phytophthora fragariae]|uniref:RxLR effector protein n=1 Tax=Phytophthora fragariae TaxID=53985 RepID=A0A6A3YXU7_9STRA|nr:hypothetical protein PF003_g39634 [Phytophthora fragariae]KAE8947966.1 hypothetical protein PF009_g2444 [Phytophthora fragariae]KAE9028440.1 hypothetical protein PF011_g1555 [Phytophthora fragariae]KAE9136100.1 hypothetical protein PF007_g2299 [Phytophthora fragariae]KAE9136143.1 hypothetical protein PF010_g1793 [Phytophthora fragariae]
MVHSRLNCTQCALLCSAFTPCLANTLQATSVPFYRERVNKELMYPWLDYN